jgi:tetratricopeptide (TPR) repeat protein
VSLASVLATPATDAASPAAVSVAREADRILDLSTRSPRQSLALARRSLAKKRRLEPNLRARLLRVYGHALRAAGEYAAARRAYHSARALYARAGDELERAVAALGLVDACMYLGRTTEALAVADDARAVFLRRRDPRRLGMLETNVGNLYLQAEDVHAALDHYERAARVLAPIGTPVQLASLDHNRANALTHLGRREEAERAYRSAEAAFTAAGETILAAQVNYGIACLHFLHGEYASAIAELEDVRPRLLALGARPLLALADLDLAEVLVAMRLYPEARALARSAWTWFRARGVGAQEARCLLVLAIANLGLGQEGEARTAVDAADRRFARLAHAPGRALADLIRCQLDLAAGAGNAAGARALRARRTFARAGFPNRALSAGALAIEALLEAGRWTRARTLARALSRVPVQPGDAFSRMRLARAEGVACARLGDGRAALAAYREAIAASKLVHSSQFVDEWRIGFLGGQPALLDESLGVLLAQRPAPQPRAIWDWIARVSAAEQDPGMVSRECSPAVARQIGRLRSELESCYAQLWRMRGMGDPPTRSVAGLRLERRALALEGRLRRLAGAAARPRRGSSRRPARTVTQGAGDVSIAYFSAAGKLGAVRHDAAGWTQFPALLDMRELDRHVDLLCHQMDVRASSLPSLAGHVDALRERAHRHMEVLGRALLDPVLEVGVAPERLEIVPFGPLHRVPFHALPWRGSTLALTTEVAVALHPWVTPARGARPRRGAWVVAFDPDGDAAILEEARTVAQRLVEGGATVELREGARADRAALVAAARDGALVHVVGHALYRPQHPEFSALRLADGCFNVRDLAALDLRNVTVVLSACETGPRESRADYEGLGLVRGLMRAGARTVLASHWRVDDRATSAQMGSLYAIWPGAGTISRAFRQAQLRSAVTTRDPFLWAAFSLFGDGSSRWPGRFMGRADSGRLMSPPAH